LFRHLFADVPVNFSMALNIIGKPIGVLRVEKVNEGVSIFERRVDSGKGSFLGKG
jgi:hypothetical protein